MVSVFRKAGVPKWMLRCIELWFVGFSNHDIKKLSPGVLVSQRILVEQGNNIHEMRNIWTGFYNI